MNPITSAKSKLGFVGVGYMGRPIARRLLEAGFKLAAYDRDRNKAQELIRYGGTVAENVAELSSSCNVVLSCLPRDRKSTRLNSSHQIISYAVFCLKKKKTETYREASA